VPNSLNFGKGRNRSPSLNCDKERKREHGEKVKADRFKKLSVSSWNKEKFLALFPFFRDKNSVFVPEKVKLTFD
jgi:hypothetical protein